MATRSAIGVMHGDNCKMVYCHWDGYLEHNGEILQKYYDSPKANHLVALGNLSSLRPNIGEQHPFSKYEINDKSPNVDALIALYEEADSKGWSTFYGRDRGQEDEDYRTFTKFTDAVQYYQNCGVEFIYIMHNDTWYVTSGDMTEMVSLETALKEAETV
jgi:hypothetical protein